MRLAVGGIAHETNTFSPLRTDLAEFRVARGDGILERRWVPEIEEVTWVPTLCARAIPHGLVLRGAYEALKSELLSRLSESMPVDGVYLALHGAMEVEEIGDGETDLVRAVRETVGPYVPIVASLDLHANVSPEFAHTADVLTAMRTAPHVDGDEVRNRAVHHLVRCVREGIRPLNVLVKLPLILPGEYAVTEQEPARSLYARLRDIETRPGILDASLLIGCAWTDSPYTAVSVIVVAESDPTPAAEAARALAGEVWSRRGEFSPDVETVPLAEAVALAMVTDEGPVVIADSGDNVTAGAAGDIPLALGALVHAGAENSVVCPLADPESVDRCAAAGEGGLVRLAIGGKLDRAAAKPLDVEALILRVTDSLAVVRIAGVEAVLTRERRGSFRMDTYEEARIDPRERHIAVAKQGYLAGELRAIARRTIMATTPGATSLMLSDLPYERLTRPIYPLDDDAAWEGVTEVRSPL